MVVVTKVMVPLEVRKGLKSRISGHFGRAPYYAVIDMSGSDVKVDFIENPRSSGCRPGEYAVVSGINYVVVRGGIGIRALDLMRRHGIKVVEVGGETLEDVIKEFRSGSFREYLGEGCPGEHH
ncbi:MAG: NifB/NifX family molybdenum-iron cluster-binding protein [Desulfurococcales archaeon]|nr:NifB/NifX family molybdenum-iron cluster-binding protein [Desulfurococcales archaeon]